MENNDTGLKKEAVTSEYKGHTLLCLPFGGDSDKTFNFGLTKAKTIVLYFDDIKAFVEKEKLNRRE